MERKPGRPPKDNSPAKVAERKLAGKRFSELRKKHNWTQEEVSELLDKSVATIGRYEQGECDIPKDTLDKFGRIARADTQYLYSDSSYQSYEEYVSIHVCLDQLMDAQSKMLKEHSNYREIAASAFAFFGYQIEFDAEVSEAVYKSARLKGESISETASLTYKIINVKNPAEWFYCRESEFLDICAAITDLVSFWGYRKNSRNQALQNGLFIFPGSKEHSLKD